MKTELLDHIKCKFKTHVSKFGILDFLENKAFFLKTHKTTGTGVNISDTDNMQMH